MSGGVILVGCRWWWWIDRSLNVAAMRSACFRHCEEDCECERVDPKVGRLCYNLETDMMSKCGCEESRREREQMSTRQM